MHENADGTYTFVGREKEIIRRRGENLAPAEVEEALMSHPDVSEAAVVGVPSELSEEEVKAFVVVGEDADLDAIRAWAAERLAKFKVPRYVEAVAELPAHPDRPRGQARAAARAQRRGGRLHAMSDQDWLRTGVGASDADSITVMGRDMATELLGRVSFTELAFLLVQRRMPEPGEARLLDAVLVSLADHGLTPTVLAARLTHTGAPESLQGAIAAGLLGGGSVFLGVVEDTAVFLEQAIAEGLDAEEAVRRRMATGRPRPRPRPPGAQGRRTRARRSCTRSPRRSGSSAPTCGCCGRSPRPTARARGATLPINGAGVGGAALADLGFPPALVRGFALLARTAGLLGHLAEEMEHPLGHGDLPRDRRPRDLRPARP